jgi:hypothetical protein
MLTLIIAFPIKVAPKNVLNGIPKCPHVIPAKSNKGFGIYITYIYTSKKKNSYESMFV